MTWLLLTLCLAAEPQEPAAPQPPPAPATPLELAASTAATSGLLLASTAAAISAGASLSALPWALEGRPRPWVTTSGLLVALGVQFALAHLTVPLVATLLRPGHDLARVREQAWSLSRWGLVAGGVGVLTSALGATLEETAYGRGQALLLGGLLTTFLSLLVFDVLEGVGTAGALR